MEFVLCIRFAFTKIQTAQFIVVAQFLTIPNPSSKTLEGKEENHWVAEGNPCVGPYNARTLGISRALFLNPRTAAGSRQPFGDCFDDLIT
jgi:hypothetical protein